MTITDLVRMPRPGAAPGLDEYCDDLFACLRRSDQRHWARTYLDGLVSVPGRKSIRRISDRLDAGHGADQCLQQFVNQSPWPWEPVRRAIAGRLLAGGPARAWVAGEAVLPKNGDQSVGVARQYVPGAGRVLNCQVGMAVSVVTDAGAVPVDWRLLMPRCWDTDERRRRRTGVPAAETHRHRWTYLLEMVDELAGTWGLRPPPLCIDATDVQPLGPLLRALEDRRLRYLVRAPQDCTVTSATGGAPTRLATLAHPGGGRTVLTHSVREPHRAELTTYCSAPVPVHPGSAASGSRPLRQPRRVLTRWVGRRPEPEDLYLTNLTGIRLPELVELTGHVARATDELEQLDADCGLGHFEGRSYRGWHHHATLVSAAQGFRVESRAAEQMPVAALS